MLFANSAAFLCITKLGAMPSMPWRHEVEDFLGKYFPNEKFFWSIILFVLFDVNNLLNNLF